MSISLLIQKTWCAWLLLGRSVGEMRFGGRVGSGGKRPEISRNWTRCMQRIRGLPGTPWGEGSRKSSGTGVPNSSKRLTCPNPRRPSWLRSRPRPRLRRRPPLSQCRDLQNPWPPRGTQPLGPCPLLQRLWTLRRPSTRRNPTRPWCHPMPRGPIRHWFRGRSSPFPGGQDPMGTLLLLFGWRSCLRRTLWTQGPGPAACSPGSLEAWQRSAS